MIARKDTLGYRAAKFVRPQSHRRGGRRPDRCVALIAGIVGTAWQARVARRERARAEQRFEDVRQLANAALLEIHDAIRDLPGATPARQLLVSKGLEYLDKLARDAGDRADLQRELAGAYLKVGDVQGRPLNPNLGDTAGALASYRKAVAIYESLGAATSADPALRRELALASQRLSEILSATGDTKGSAGRRPAAASSSCSSRHGRRIAGKSVAAADLGRELAASYTRVGDLLSATGDTAGALEHRRRRSRSWKPSRRSRPTTWRRFASWASPIRSSGTSWATRTIPTSAIPRARWCSSSARRRCSRRRCRPIRPTPFSGGTWRLPTATSPTC